MKTKIERLGYEIVFEGMKNILARYEIFVKGYEKSFQGMKFLYKGMKSFHFFEGMKLFLRV